MIDNSIAEISPISVSKNGLLGPATTVIEDNTIHWVNGFSYPTLDGRISSSNQVIYGTQEEFEVVHNPNGPLYRLYRPFDIKTSVSLSTMGHSRAETESLAQEALGAVTQKNLEVEFWTGQVAKVSDPTGDGNRYLASTKAIDVTPTAGTPIHPVYGLARLEQALGYSTVGSEGVIHTSKEVASTFINYSAEQREIKTSLGTHIIAGAGYDTTGPDGVEPPSGQAWMYATGPITVILGAVEIYPNENQSVDTLNNTIEYFVDRPAAVVWSTSELFAVLVDVTKGF